MVLITKFKSVFAIFCLLILSIASSIFLGNEKYMFIAIISAAITLIPLFAKFEQRNNSSREIVTIAVMVALCTASRILFVFIPHFKPVTALVIIIGMYLGCDAGFITGSFTALFSNMQYGQGPWTVFQMAVWGLIGFISGLLNKRKLLEKNKLVLYSFSAFSGVIFSLVMDIYTTLNLDSAFSFERYIFLIASSLPIMVNYIISNIIFMVVLNKPIGKKLQRIKLKYGIFK